MSDSGRGEPAGEPLRASPSPPAVPWTLRDLVWGGAATVVWLLALIAFAVLARVDYTRMDPSVLVFALEAPAILPVLWLALGKYKAGWAALGFRPFRLRALLAGCGLLAVLYGFNLVFALILLAFGLVVPNAALELLDLGGSPWLLLLAATTLPLVEEVLFRGFFFAGLRRRFGWVRAGVASAALFALVHASPLAFLPLFVVGFLFAALYELSGSIWPSIIVHAVNNALAVAAVVLADRFLPL